MEDLAVALYYEHLEEASFLYEQRLFLLDDPELNWTDLHDFEERFEAHIDALVLGDDLALAVCTNQAHEGDLGELHAAARVFCRQNRPDLFQELADSLDLEDDERVKAVEDALCDELPASWQRTIEDKFAEGDPTFTRVAARALGYRRIPASEALIESLEHLETRSIPQVLWSVGRLRDPQARQVLYNTYLQHDSGEVRSAAALALLRIGEPATVQYCAGIARSEPWALIPIGLGGGRAHHSLLMDIAASEAVSTQCMLALGLQGDTAAIEPLLYHLGDDMLTAEAAVAMYMITGAELFEEEFIPEEVDPDEFFDEELAQMEGADEQPLAANEPPVAANEARGTTITRLCRQPEAWQEWWHKNKALFKTGLRYRNGRPYAPECLVENLSSERSPRIVRRLAAEELVIRYGCDQVFEPELFVVEQIAALANIGAWVAGHADTFEPGNYYLAGRALSR